MTEIKKLKSLSGHSGCSVELCLMGDFYFVRKTSASAGYNARLVRQIEKQEAVSGIIRTPKIYDSGMIDGLDYFDMEYVRGHGFVSYAPLQSLANICAMVERLSSSIRDLALTSADQLNPRHFTSKVADLAETLPISPFFSDHRGFLYGMIDSMAQFDWAGIPRSQCHGDLTVENMILTDDGQIVFIDLLDGPLESVWMDIAKLVHDLDSGWSLRSVLWTREVAASGRLLRSLTRYLAEEVEAQIANLIPQISAFLPQLRALQALRVLPYVKNQETFAHVVRGLKRIELSKEIA